VCNEKLWILHQDNAPSRNEANSSREVHSKARTITCSPELAAGDFYLFPKVKNVVKGSHFQSVSEMKLESSDP
jgi:hypothetical protein